MNQDPTDTRPPLPQRRRTPTMADEQTDALNDEFPEFQIWRDWRPMDDDAEHFHARKSGWAPWDIISALDPAGMQTKLRAYRDEHPSESPEHDR